MRGTLGSDGVTQPPTMLLFQLELFTVGEALPSGLWRAGKEQGGSSCVSP